MAIRELVEITVVDGKEKRRIIKKASNISTLNRYARSKGWIWKKNSSLFGGYWTTPKGTKAFEIR